MCVAAANRSEGVLAPGTAYVIPARVGVWLPGGCFLGSDVRLGFVVFCCLVVLSLARGVGVFRGTLPGTGTTRMRSPDRDLQNVPQNLGLEPPKTSNSRET